MRTGTVSLIGSLLVAMPAAAETITLYATHPLGDHVFAPVGQTVSGSLYIVGGNAPPFEVSGAGEMGLIRFDTNPWAFLPSSLSIVSEHPLVTFQPLAGRMHVTFSGVTADFPLPGTLIGTWSWTPGPEHLGHTYGVFGDHDHMVLEYRRNGELLPNQGWGTGSINVHVVPAPASLAPAAFMYLGLARRRERSR